MCDIEDHPEKNFTVYPVGDDISELKGALDFAQMNREIIEQQNR